MDEDIEALTKRTQDGRTRVVEEKDGKGSATMYMAYVGAIFFYACLKGLNGVQYIVESTYVHPKITEFPFFASKVSLGKSRIEEVLGLGPISSFEQHSLEVIKLEPKSFIEKELKFVVENSVRTLFMVL